MQFICSACGEFHDGLPGLSSEAPLYYYSVPQGERGARCRLGADTCVVDDRFFFVRGCLEVPILEAVDPFVWGVWLSLSRQSFARYLELDDQRHRSHAAPLAGWLSAALKGYPDTQNLRAMMHLRDHDVRPFIELEPTDHPLAVEQRSGISVARVGEILSAYVHGHSDGRG